MKPLFIATLCTLCASVAAADVTVSFANGTSKTFDTVTVYAMTAGKAGDDSLGSLTDALKPGESATVSLSLTKCQPVFVQALWGENGIATTEADACDRAIFTLTE